MECKGQNSVERRRRVNLVFNLLSHKFCCDF